MKNNRVFILCDTTRKGWQMPCANAERHIESRRFAAQIEHDFDTMLSAVSPRRVLDGTEDGRTKFRILRKAMRECRYVYPLEGFENDPTAMRLYGAARWRFKTFIQTEGY